jgi:tryptophanyl-tRNA synthetase
VSSAIVDYSPPAGCRWQKSEQVALDPDVAEVNELKQRYRNGGLGDVPLKRRLESVLDALIAPIRTRRAELARDPTYIVKVLRDGSERAAAVTEAVLRDVRRAFALDP